MKRKPQKLGKNTQKSQKMGEKDFLRILGKTAPDSQVRDFLREWRYLK